MREMQMTGQDQHRTGRPGSGRHPRSHQPHPWDELLVRRVPPRRSMSCGVHRHTTTSDQEFRKHESEQATGQGGQPVEEGRLQPSQPHRDHYAQVIHSFPVKQRQDRVRDRGVVSLPHRLSGPAPQPVALVLPHQAEKTQAGDVRTGAGALPSQGPLAGRGGVAMRGENAGVPTSEVFRPSRHGSGTG